MAWQKQIKSRRGRTYCQSEYDNSWWVTFPIDRPNLFIGATHNLPKEILKKLEKKTCNQ